MRKLTFTFVSIAVITSVFLTFRLWNNGSVFNLDQQMESMMSSERRVLSDAVILYWTGGDAYSISDKDGFGLIHGKVQKISYDENDRNFVIVQFVPFKKEEGNTGSSHFAKVSLVNGTVTELAVSQMQQRSIELERVEDFMD